MEVCRLYIAQDPVDALRSLSCGRSDLPRKAQQCLSVTLECVVF